jgi:hypothetical protein
MMEYVSFDDVLDDLILEESFPDQAALLKWKERYPKFEKELEEYFATWTHQLNAAEDDDFDEDQIVERGVRHALEILQEQGRIIPDDEVESLESFDQLVLTAVYLLNGEGDAVGVTEKVSQMLGQEAIIESTFISLRKLEARGLIDSWVPDTDAEPEVDNQYFNATITGEQALAEAKVSSKVVADFLGDFA